MNNKNYKGYATPKLHDKLTHLNQLLFSVEYMIAGGSVFSEIQKSLHVNTSNTVYNDVDLFFQTEKEYNKAIELFDGEKAKNEEQMKILQDKENRKNPSNFGYLNQPEPYLENDSEAALTYYWKNIQIQLIKHFNPFEKTLNDFDLVNSMCYSTAPFDTSYAFDIENIFTYVIRNNNKKITFNDINRSLKYKEKKSLNEINIVQDAFDLFLDYDDSAFKRSTYAGEKIDTKEKQQQTVKTTLINICRRSEQFQNYAVEKEDEGLRLPFDIISDKEIGYIPTTGIRYLTYLQALEQQRRGISFDKFQKAQDYMIENFPEELL